MRAHAERDEPVDAATDVERLGIGTELALVTVGGRRSRAVPDLPPRSLCRRPPRRASATRHRPCTGDVSRSNSSTAFGDQRRVVEQALPFFGVARSAARPHRRGVRWWCRSRPRSSRTPCRGFPRDRCRAPRRRRGSGRTRHRRRASRASPSTSPTKYADRSTTAAAAVMPAVVASPARSPGSTRRSGSGLPRGRRGSARRPSSGSDAPARSTKSPRPASASACTCARTRARKRGLECCDVARREAAAHESAVARVLGRIHEHHRLHPEVRALVLECQPVRGRERRGVACRVEHVLEPREHPVAAGAPVDGVLVAQAPVERVRIAPCVPPEWAVLDGGGHDARLRRARASSGTRRRASEASKLLARSERERAGYPGA